MRSGSEESPESEFYRGKGLGSKDGLKREKTMNGEKREEREEVAKSERSLRRMIAGSFSRGKCTREREKLNDEFHFYGNAPPKESCREWGMPFGAGIFSKTLLRNYLSRV